MTTILGVDPGQTTGCAYLIIMNSACESWSNTLPWIDWACAPEQFPVAEREARIGRYIMPPYPDTIALEKLVPGKRTVRTRTVAAINYTNDVIRDVNYIAERMSIPVVTRSASTVKRWATDERLEAAGLLAATVGMPHARDASRHALFTAVADYGMVDPLSARYTKG